MQLNLTIVKVLHLLFMRKIYSVLLLAMLLCIGCEWRLGDADNHPEWLLTISRYDRVQSLYLTTGDLSALQQMNTEYPQQTRTLIEDVLRLGKVNDPLINKRLLSFYQDSTLQTVIAETQRQYADVDDINGKLSDAFENLLKLLPSLCVPEVYMQIGSFDQSIIVSGEMLGISLDKYLGADYPIYQRYGYSRKQLRQMQREYIVPDCISFYLLSQYAHPEDTTVTRQQRDEQLGRIQWVVNHVMKRRFFDSEKVRKADDFIKKHKGMSIDAFLKQ